MFINRVSYSFSFSHRYTSVTKMASLKTVLSLNQSSLTCRFFSVSSRRFASNDVVIVSAVRTPMGNASLFVTMYQNFSSLVDLSVW